MLPSTVKVEVTVEEEARNPPYSWRVVVAKEPRAVTVARVSDSVVRNEGQLVELARHTALPLTKMELAFRREPEALVKKRFVVVAFVSVALVPVRA